MNYYAINSTDDGNNTGWTFATLASQYFADNSVNAGNNTGWIFVILPAISSSGLSGRNVIANAISI